MENPSVFNEKIVLQQLNQEVNDKQYILDVYGKSFSMAIYVKQTFWFYIDYVGTELNN